MTLLFAFLALLFASAFGFAVIFAWGYRSEGLWQQRRAEGWRKRYVNLARKVADRRTGLGPIDPIEDLVTMSDQPVTLTIHANPAPSSGPIPIWSDR